MKKYSIRFLAMMICIVLIASVPVYAASQEGGDYTIQPRWTELGTFQCTMTRQSGLFTNARAASTVSTYSAHSKVELTVTVQEYSGGTFVDTSLTWSSSGTGATSIGKDLNLPSGNYRIKAVVAVYSSTGAYIETITKYSSDIVI